MNKETPVRLHLKNSWGVNRYYPAPTDTQALLFTKLLDQQSLTVSQVKVIRELGYEVEISNHYVQPL